MGGVIIGKGGAEIRRIQSESGAYVKVDGEASMAQLEGSTAAVTKVTIYLILIEGG